MRCIICIKSNYYYITNITNITNNTNNFVGSENDSAQCNVYKCQKLVKYIKKIINKPPIKIINKVIKHLYTFDDSLKMTIFEIEF